MTRLEEHEAIIDQLNQLAATKQYEEYEEMMIFHLAIIGTALVDISKSLAVIADKAESEE